MRRVLVAGAALFLVAIGTIPWLADPPPHLVLDIAKAREVFDWSPAIGLRDGIGLHHEWMRAVRNP